MPLWLQVALGESIVEQGQELYHTLTKKVGGATADCLRRSMRPTRLPPCSPQ